MKGKWRIRGQKTYQVRFARVAASTFWLIETLRRELSSLLATRLIACEGAVHRSLVLCSALFWDLPSLLYPIHIRQNTPITIKKDVSIWKSLDVVKDSWSGSWWMILIENSLNLQRLDDGPVKYVLDERYDT